jgi:hypothetical protein
VVSVVEFDDGLTGDGVDTPLSGIVTGRADGVVRVLVAVGIVDEDRERDKAGVSHASDQQVSHVFEDCGKLEGGILLQTTMSNLISCVSWVRRGVSAQNPSKYVLDDKELERVSALARIKLDDARVELERAHEAAKSMGRGAEGEEADDAAEEDGEDGWVE